MRRQQTLGMGHHALAHALAGHAAPVALAAPAAAATPVTVARCGKPGVCALREVGVCEHASEAVGTARAAAAAFHHHRVRRE
jgi:hypothetical protein